MDSGSDITIPSVGMSRSDHSRDEASSERNVHVSSEPGGQKRRRPPSILGASPIDEETQGVGPSGNRHHQHQGSSNETSGHGSTRGRPEKRLRQDDDAIHSLAFDTGPSRHHRQSHAEHGHYNEEDDGDGQSPARPSLRTLVIHQVQCGAPNTNTSSNHHSANTISFHANHPPSATYFDHPALFAGDSAASSLRGQDPIHNLEDYLESELRSDGHGSGIGLVVIHIHSCREYHALHRDEFIRLRQPQNPPIPPDMRAFFMMLNKPGRPSVEQTETIRLSEPLERALRMLGQIDPSLADCHVKERLVPPYLQLWHAREVIREKIEMGILEEVDVEFVSLLMEYIKDRFGADYDDAEKLFAQGLVSREHLVKLFWPGDVVVTLDDAGEPRCYVLLECSQSEDGDTVMLDCYTWTYDGSFRKVNHTVEVAWKSNRNGTRPISGLSAYPLRFDPTGTLENALRDRGKMFWACRTRCFVGYDAPMTTFEIQVSNPRYMVDMGTYLELHRKNSATGGGGEVDGPEGDDVLIIQEEPPDQTFLLLLPPKMLGFGLHDKKWKSLLVKHMHPVRWNKKAFEQLVLDPQKKELIEAMVTIHMTSNMSTDVIEGKGKGLIILLHGGPGTGKTLTAESVAELAERPLYRVTCGDIGTDPESVESYLESVLYIGSIWKAVVLLDESDVFLEEREKTDLQRNVLVSVFLRVLEYYEGILILTSNRVGHFDEAFKSRVQLSLHYPPLDEKGRWQIWSNFIKILQKQQEAAHSSLALGDTGLASNEQVNIEELRDKIDVLAKERLNGRQIRNAITSARQLARFREKPLGYLHLDQTIRVVDEFERYVEKTHGHSAGDYARASGMRLE